MGWSELKFQVKVLSGGRWGHRHDGLKALGVEQRLGTGYFFTWLNEEFCIEYCQNCSSVVRQCKSLTSKMDLSEPRHSEIISQSTNFDDHPKNTTFIFSQTAECTTPAPPLRTANFHHEVPATQNRPPPAQVLQPTSHPISREQSRIE